MVKLSQDKLNDALKNIQRKRYSGTVYLPSNQKFSCHIIQFKRGHIVKTIELYYHHYDTHTNVGFKHIPIEAIIKLRGFRSVVRHLINTFYTQQDNN